MRQRSILSIEKLLLTRSADEEGEKVKEVVKEEPTEEGEAEV